MRMLAAAWFHAIHFGIMFGAPLVAGTIFVVVDKRKSRARDGVVVPGSLARSAFGGDADAPSIAPPTHLWTLAALSAGAGVIHAGVVREHARESFLFAAFFVAAAGAQMLWAMAILRRLDPKMFAAAAFGNAAIVILWILSRTTGVPIGPSPGVAEPVNVLGVLATAYEVALVIACAMLASRSDGAGAWARGRALGAFVLLVALASLMLPRALD